MILAATVLGLWIGRSVRHKATSLREPFAVMQAALLGFMGLILAFGLSLAVQRYEGRRGAAVALGLLARTSPRSGGLFTVLLAAVLVTLIPWSHSTSTGRPAVSFASRPLH